QELPALDFQNHGGFVRIAILVDRDLAGHPRMVLRLIDRVAEFGAFGGIASFDRIKENVCSIEAKSGEAVRSLAESCPVLGHELLNDGVRIIGGIVIREERTVQ